MRDNRSPIRAGPPSTTRPHELPSGRQSWSPGGFLLSHSTSWVLSQCGGCDSDPPWRTPVTARTLRAAASSGQGEGLVTLSLLDAPGGEGLATLSLLDAPGEQSCRLTTSGHDLLRKGSLSIHNEPTFPSPRDPDTKVKPCVRMRAIRYQCGQAQPQPLGSETSLHPPPEEINKATCRLLWKTDDLLQ